VTPEVAADVLRSLAADEPLVFAMRWCAERRPRDVVREAWRAADADALAGLARVLRVYLTIARGAYAPHGSPRGPWVRYSNGRRVSDADAARILRRAVRLRALVALVEENRG
jgi:hypothetical protein